MSSANERLAELNRQFSSLQKYRHKFVPLTPQVLTDIANNKVAIEKSELPIKDELINIFPSLLAKGAAGMPQLSFNLDNDKGSIIRSHVPLRIGCVLSGGQAAGGHNVIMGLFDMVRKLNPESKLFGFLNGPHGIFTNNYMEITPEFMGLFRNTGGFDMIRSGRHKIETPEQFASSLANCKTLDLDGLVVIGGDDSNTNACLLAEYFSKEGAKTKVIGCPKTIDGDLQNEHIPVSFGFDTATKVYSEAIGNLCSDVISSKEYYHFVRLMGRSASHIALECALRTQINCVLIGEEVEAKKQTLAQITQQVADIICKRSAMNKNYGVMLVPEGLIEFIPEMSVLISEINELLAKPFEGAIRDYVSKSLTKESCALFTLLPQSISNQLLLDRDPHGNVQVSKIDTEKLLILLLQKELAVRAQAGAYKGKFNPQAHFFGYEGRCALPSNFDSNYCYSLGMNAAVMIFMGLTGYMSCIKNLKEKDVNKWEAAGCPLPTMMGIERRHGKDKPVISKSLVKLDQGMFKAYEAMRDKWAIYDCYLSPGPIQFEGPGSDEINFMVMPPDMKQLERDTLAQEKAELEICKTNPLYRDPSLLSALSQARIKDLAAIPEQLQRGDVRMAAIKKYFPITEEARLLMEQQLPQLVKDSSSDYFVEMQDQLLTNKTYKATGDDVMNQLNEKLLATDKTAKQKIGLVYLGRQAAGANNVVDGLLRFAAGRGNTEIIGFMNGVEGLYSKNFSVLKEDDYKNYRNLGGIDFIGRGSDELRSKEQKKMAADACIALGLTGLVMVGATHTLTDAVFLADYFLAHKVDTRVIVAPCSVDGNIHHNYIQTSIGFDSASKVYSQLIGNMLTDSASAIKYWYFIRLMGREPSHVALECALKTNPNMVVVSEEVKDRKETLIQVVHRICDIIVQRANDGNNYGAVLIPEGLLSSISSFESMLQELNAAFDATDDKQKLIDEPEKLRELMTKWSYSLFESFPDFFRNQLLVYREMSGDVKLSQIETEKLLAYLCDVELKERKKKGTYKGSFAPVTHFFGYQGRSGHPSLFDCSLGSTMGYAAGALVEAGLTGMAVSVQSVTKNPQDWRVGGVPICGLLSLYPKQGFTANELAVKSENVDLGGRPFQRQRAIAQQWREQDLYKNPGPVQFFLKDQAENTRITDTIRMRYGKKDQVTDEILGLCHSIQNDCLFTEHQHLLFAALSSLKSAKDVMNSLAHSVGNEQ